MAPQEPADEEVREHAVAHDRPENLIFAIEGFHLNKQLSFTQIILKQHHTL